MADGWFLKVPGDCQCDPTVVAIVSSDLTKTIRFDLIRAKLSEWEQAVVAYGVRRLRMIVGGKQQQVCCAVPIIRARAAA